MKRVKRFIRGCCKRRVFWKSSAVHECLTNEILENITDENGDCITS